MWYTHSHSIWLADLFRQAGIMYGGIRADTVLETSVACDHIIFSQLGYPAFTSIEPDPDGNPYIHTPNDLTANLSTSYLAGFTKTALATIILLDKIPAPVNNLTIKDMGDGTSLKVYWDQAPELAITGYMLSWGKSSGNYNDSLFIPGVASVCDTIESLMTDTTYYIAVRSLSSDEYQSVVATEGTGIPRVAPLPPMGLTTTSMIMSIKLDWLRGNELDLAGYRVFRKINDGGWDSLNVVLINDTTTFTDSVPDRDAKYWYSLSVYDNDGNVSDYADSIPAYTYTATGLRATPIYKGIAIEWPQNNTTGIAGYRLYRKIDQGVFDSLNQILMSDTSYIDSPLVGSNKYYYRYCAFDNVGLPSRISDSVYARPFTLDQGILLVDETYNWITSGYPRDAQQDSFYNYLMAGYKYEQYDFGSVIQKPILADLGPYSTILWHSDDPSQFLASNDSSALREYLNSGGKLWFTGWKPTGDIRNSTIYPASIAAGNVLYDYLKINYAELSGTTDSFKTAVGLIGYPDITIDTLKYPSTIWGKTFRNIEALKPLAGADTIYVMDMKNNASPYEGRACAVRDSGRTVFFGFPLYYMDKGQARAAAQKILAEFGEVPMGISVGTDNRGQITGVRLFQNAPNPFSQSTIINYQLAKSGLVSLKVYNVAGQLVKMLDEGYRISGAHSIKWDGRDESGKNVSNGIYLYRLQAGDISQTGKMIVLR